MPVNEGWWFGEIGAAGVARIVYMRIQDRALCHGARRRLLQRARWCRGERRRSRVDRRTTTTMLPRLVGDDTFEGRVSAPGLDPHRADPTGERGRLSRLDLGDAGAVGGEVEWRDVGGAAVRPAGELRMTDNVGPVSPRPASSPGPACRAEVVRHDRDVAVRHVAEDGA